MLKSTGVAKQAAHSCRHISCRQNFAAEQISPLMFADNKNIFTHYSHVLLTARICLQDALIYDAVRTFTFSQ